MAEIVDLFHCKYCDEDFDLTSEKVKGKEIVCPICRIPVKAWQKNWESQSNA